jgi:hypothetical protein
VDKKHDEVTKLPEKMSKVNRLPEEREQSGEFKVQSFNILMTNMMTGTKILVREVRA